MGLSKRVLWEREVEGETVPGALEVSGVLEALPVPGEPPAACGGEAGGRGGSSGPACR